MTNGVQVLDGISDSQIYYAFLNLNISLFWDYIETPHFIKKINTISYLIRAM